MQVGEYTVDILIQGYPGRSASHGGLGWGTVALVRGHDRVCLVDTGSFGMRQLVIKRLAEHGLNPADVTDVLVTHAHHDHMINWPLFHESRVVVGRTELVAAAQAPWGETPIPEMSVAALTDWATLHQVEDQEEVLPDLVAHIAPGHTSGSLVYVIAGPDRDVIFTGDAAKNRAELLCGNAQLTGDAAASARSIESIWALWRRRRGSVLVPGHDLPMTQEDGTCTYVGERRADIEALFGDDVSTPTVFDISRR